MAHGVREDNTHLFRRPLKEGELAVPHGLVLRRPKMGIDARKTSPERPCPPRHAPRICGGDAVAVHARIHGKMKGNARLRRKQKGAGGRDGRGELVCPKAQGILLVEGRSEDEDVLPDARDAKGSALPDRGDAESRGDAVKNMGDGRRPVAVSVVLDDGQKGHPRPCPQEPRILPDASERYLCHDLLHTSIVCSKGLRESNCSPIRERGGAFSEAYLGNMTKGVLAGKRELPFSETNLLKSRRLPQSPSATAPPGEEPRRLSLTCF